MLVRLLNLAVDGLGNNLRLTDGQLKALTTHSFNQNGQRHFTTALHLPGIRALGRQHAQRDVTNQLLVQAGLDHTSGQLIATTLACQWRGVHADRHRNSRLIDQDARQRVRMLGITERVTDHDLVDTGDSGDVTSNGLFSRYAGHADGTQQLRDLRILDMLIALGVVMNPRNLLSLADTALMDTNQTNSTEEGAGVQVGNLRLQRGINLSGRLREHLGDDVEQRLQVLRLRQVAVTRVLGRSLTGTTRGIENRQLKVALSDLSSFRVFQGGG